MPERCPWPAGFWRNLCPVGMVLLAILSVGAQQRAPNQNRDLPAVVDPLLPGDAKVLPKRNVVVLKDGDSWYFDRLMNLAVMELKSLAEGTYELTVRELNAGDDLDETDALLTRSLADPEIDLILAAGYNATMRSMSLEAADRTRPIIGCAIEFSNSLETAISSEGTSTFPNYSFVADPQRAVADLEMLRDLSERKTIYALIDQSAHRRFEDKGDLDQVKRQIQSRLGISIEMIPVGDTVASVLSAIPGSARAIYVSVLPSLDPDQRKRLFTAMARRGLFSLSIVGVPDVKLGAIAGLAPDNREAVARRIALNSHQVLLGTDPRNLPVYLPVEDRLVINRASADLARWYPRYDTALSANFINDGSRNRGEILNLEKAMGIAAQGNADVIIQQEQALIAKEDLSKAESFRRPSINLNVQQSITDYLDRINPRITPDRLSAGSYGVQLQQSLFNDSIRSNIGAALENVAAERLNIRSRQLDAMEAAGVAYLNYLAADALLDIQQENLRLSENNLQLAKLRVDIGASESSEVFRWEQDVAASRSSVFQIEADRENARIELNRILGQARDKRWSFTDIELGNRETYFMGDLLIQTMHRENDVQKFGAFLKRVAVPASPELAAFDFGLSAQGIKLEQVERSFFLPEISGFLGLTRSGQGTEVFEYTTQGERIAGVQLSFPLYEGGLREAEFAGQRAEIRQLAAQRQRALQLIEQSALTSLNGLTSEHPRIRLGRVALDAAEKNYDSVRNKYSQGAASILDLLDAQGALLRQRQEAALAVYSYLQEVVRMQRSVAWFEFEKSDTEKRAWEKMLVTYMRHNRLEFPGIVSPVQDSYDPRERAAAVVHAATPEMAVPCVEARPVTIRATPVAADSIDETGSSKNRPFSKFFRGKR